MKWVEFTNVPPKFEVNNTPDGMSIIRFYCDQKEFAHDTEISSTGYKAICYEMQTKQSSTQHDRVERNYDAWLEKAKEQDGDLEAVKKEKIMLSKTKLADYLATHPLASYAHNNTIGTYSVTEAKQTLMMGQYVSYQAEKLVNPNAVLTWNETGKGCEVWTEPEFLQLIVEIKQYVYPLVSRQQTLEELINAASALDELDSIEVDYES